MPLPLSRKCQRVAEHLFSEPRLSLISARLVNEAAENLPFHANSSPSDMDRIRFAIMKLISSPKANVDAIFALAKSDWRDLFMAADFGYSEVEHERWYKSLLPERPDDNDPPEEPWWSYPRKK